MVKQPTFLKAHHHALSKFKTYRDKPQTCGHPFSRIPALYWCFWTTPPPVHLTQLGHVGGSSHLHLPAAKSLLPGRRRKWSAGTSIIMFGVNDVDLHVAIDVVYAYRRGRYSSWWKWIQRLIHKIYIHKYTIHVGYSIYLQKLITKHAPSQTEHARENTVTANAFTLRKRLVYLASNPNNHCWDVRNPLAVGTRSCLQPRSGSPLF